MFSENPPPPSCEECMLEADARSCHDYSVLLLLSATLAGQGAIGRLIFRRFFSLRFSCMHVSSQIAICKKKCPKLYAL
jgi:hypothetical protein